ncbi:MAG: hypothetical protein IPK12_15250 [Gemmatimonadetes bacterium]|nr:hypothetical protein [Gemmatimonadota bacterium]
MTSPTAPAAPTGTTAALSPEVAESRVSAASLARVGILALQLALTALVVRELRIESFALYTVMVVAAVAFPVHALLAPVLRMRAFAVISVAGLVLVLQPKAALAVFGIGAVLVGLVQLPVRWGVKLALLSVAGVGLALLRTGTIPSPLPHALWPVLGAIFMFRLALYAHAWRHKEAPTGFWPTLGYFAMLPNVAFPLFPVVDYKAFIRNHYDAPDFLIYERGMRWIARGVVHLALYRLVYHHVTMDPLDVRSLGQLVQFTLSTFLLYLRVSGQFHLIVGVLHLFGFNLPETHHLYYLASSFTDLWRRINLYWTNFMMKLVYYPAFFRLRKHGQETALLLSTAIVFLMTWLLHAYQTFWLLGAPHFTVPDALFWGILGVLVLVTTVYEKRRARRPAQRRWELGRALQVIGVFTGMSLLWSLWSSESVTEWASLFHAAGQTSTSEVLALGALLALALVVAGYPWGAATLAAAPEPAPALGAQLRAGGLRLALLGSVAALGQPAVRSALPLALRPYAESVGEPGLNARDEAMLQRGYYEQLNAADRTGGQVWNAVAERPRGWGAGLMELGWTRPVPGVLLAELPPDLHQTYKGQPFTTNAWGMRDQAYTLEKPVDTYRVAVLGPSLVMGYGIGDGEPFEAQLEAMLAAEGTHPRVELLNFAFEGHSLTQQLATFRQRAAQFRPDLVLVTLTPIEHRVAAEHVRRLMAAGASVEVPYLARVIEQAGITSADRHADVVRRLRPYDEDLMHHALRALVEQIAEAGARPALMLVRMPTQPAGPLARSAELAAEAGFTVLDLSHAYDGHEENQLRVGPWDRHPNAEANRLLAVALQHELQRTRLLPTSTPDPVSPVPSGAR